MTAAPPEQIYAVIAHNRVPLERPCLAAYHEHCRPKCGLGVITGFGLYADDTNARSHTVAKVALLDGIVTLRGVEGRRIAACMGHSWP